MVEAVHQGEAVAGCHQAGGRSPPEGEGAGEGDGDEEEVGELHERAREAKWTGNCTLWLF